MVGPHAVDEQKAKARGVGASIPRKEDARLLEGRGRFIGDMRFPGQLEAAFVRSTLAHARIRAIHIPAHLKGRAFTHADMVGVKDILAKTGLPGFRISAQPSLASDKVRFVGEPVAMVLAETRAEAEDLAEQSVHSVPFRDSSGMSTPSAATAHKTTGILSDERHAASDRSA